jgi:hypothetical protein
MFLPNPVVKLKWAAAAKIVFNLYVLRNFVKLWLATVSFFVSVDMSVCLSAGNDSASTGEFS